MEKIKLTDKEWSYDPNKPLGTEGSFGKVFEGTDSNGNLLAIKRINSEIEAISRREFAIVDKMVGRKFKYIIPIFDTGQDAKSGRYFIVMPRAEYNLAQYTQDTENVDEATASDILFQIVSGLIEMNENVHRDLKPLNILFYDKRWVISDFSITRELDKSTSSNTLKFWHSSAFAAPEQWNLERVSHATDIYALGCIGYNLLTGNPPFTGPEFEDFKNQHLHDSPQELSIKSKRLSALITSMLRKLPENRPTPTETSETLQNILDSSSNINISKGLSALADAKAIIATEELKLEAAKNKSLAHEKRRIDLAIEGYKILEDIKEVLFKEISSTLSIPFKKGSSIISFGKAHLEFNRYSNYDAIRYGTFQKSGWDVAGVAAISVEQFLPEYKWSSTLLFMRFDKSERFRWYEVSYRVWNWTKDPPLYEPFAIGDMDDADKAADQSSMNYYQIAFGPTPIDGEYENIFISRWSYLLSEASLGRLKKPKFPLSNDFFSR